MPEMTLRASISAYLDEVTVHRNPTTVRTYKGALLGLVKYLEESAAVNVDTMEASEAPVDLVVGYFKGLKRLSPSTIEVYFCAIYGWCRYLSLDFIGIRV